MCASRSDSSSHPASTIWRLVRENTEGNADQLGELGAGLNDGAGAVDWVHGTEHHDQALVGGHARGVVEDVQEPVLVIAAH
jgi:hypothetical protein